MPSQFPHLQFLKNITGLYKGSGRGNKSPQTLRNEKNLPGHGRQLKKQLNDVKRNWQASIEAAVEYGLLTGDIETIPLFLRVDPKAFEFDQLRTWGIEIISEEENGYIIAVSQSDEIVGLTTRLNKMMSGDPKGVKGMAGLWSIETRERSLESVVDVALLDRWETLDSEQECWVDISISIGVKMPGALPENASEKDRNEWLAAITEYDDISEIRQNRLREIVESNGGSIESEFSSLGDTADCRIKIPGLGIKNIFFYLPYVWEIVECDIVKETKLAEGRVYADYNPDLLPPAATAPKVCVIDSGMQTGHRLLAPAMDSSKSYVIRDSSVADSMAGGGHGTRVGGAILYPKAIPRTGTYQLPAWLQNARILEGPYGLINKNLHTPTLMRRIVNDHLPTRLYNMSVFTPIPHLRIHMSAWAAAIDQLSFEHDVLFIVCAGNIEPNILARRRKGLLQHLAAGGTYPSYLGDPLSGIGNPAQSCQAITVGSVCFDRIDTDTHTSFGENGMPSAFTRTGLGMWDMVKPDVVEYGGDSVLTKAGTLVNLPDASPELVTSMLTSNKAVSRDAVGTSFAAPKVTHIAAILQAQFPNSRTLLYRALIAQSAHWPDYAEHDSIGNKLFHFRTLGYGIPSVERATENTESRVTFITEGELTAKNASIYAIKIPGIGTPGDASDYRLEVTLSYAARPRRTRRRLRSYLSTTLQWTTAKLGESMESFQARLKFSLETSDGSEPRVSNLLGTTNIRWQLGKHKNFFVNDVRVQDSTLQKDWALIKGYELPQDRLIFAITAHEGWEKQFEKIPFAFTVTLTSIAGERIYERIEIANRIEVETEYQ